MPQKRGQYGKKVILPRREEHEEPKAGAGLVFCRNCGIVYYKKSWHHDLENYKKLRESLPVKFAFCPACSMINNKQFEGEVIVKNAPAKIKNSLLGLIETFCRRARLRDPLHRLIGIKETRGDLIITVTENQLAVKLAKKIKSTFKDARNKISYSPAPSDVVYVTTEFPQSP